jgi:hypothetical protein
MGSRSFIMMREYQFSERLAWSRSARQASDIETLYAMFDGCIHVEKTDERLDRMGVDYVVTLRDGATILIDAKAREKGCSHHWYQRMPEVALETWSVKPDPMGRYQSKVGWTLCEKKQTDFILFTFDPSDCSEAFLVSYQLLRIALQRHLEIWRSCGFRVTTQRSERWESECIFVPWNTQFGAPGVEDAINAIQRGKIATAEPSVRFT